MPRVSSVKRKCEKEIVHLVHNYSVTGRKPRKNVLLTYYKLNSFVSYFFISLPFSCYIFTSDLTSVKNDVLTFRTLLVKRDNKSRTRLFTLSKQTFPSHISEATYCLRFYRRK